MHNKKGFVSLLPMLMNPVALVIIAIIILGLGLFINSHLDKTGKQFEYDNKNFTYRFSNHKTCEVLSFSEKEQNEEMLEIKGSELERCIAQNNNLTSLINEVIKWNEQQAKYVGEIGYDKTSKTTQNNTRGIIISIVAQIILQLIPSANDKKRGRWHFALFIVTISFTLSLIASGITFKEFIEVAKSFFSF